MSSTFREAHVQSHIVRLGVNLNVLCLHKTHDLFHVRHLQRGKLPVLQLHHYSRTSKQGKERDRPWQFCSDFQVSLSFIHTPFTFLIHFKSATRHHALCAQSTRAEHVLEHLTVTHIAYLQPHDLFNVSRPYSPEVHLKSKL